MQNVKNETKTHDLKIEKTIAKPVADVYRAISEGRLFQTCSADSGSMKIDFRVGGKYELQFLHVGMANGGEFLEIVPNKKVVFTWCQDYAANPTPDTTVKIELQEKGGKTHLSLVHSGFTDLETMKDHEGGWNGGLNDLSGEICEGRLSFMRRVPVSVEKLYEVCKNPNSFFGVTGAAKGSEVDFKVGGHYAVPTEKGDLKGVFLEIAPKEKMVLSWKSAPYGEKLPHDAKVTLTFEGDDDDSQVSWLGITHEGLESESQQKAHRAGWDRMLVRLSK